MKNEPLPTAQSVPIYNFFSSTRVLNNPVKPFTRRKKIQTFYLLIAFLLLSAFTTTAQLVANFSSSIVSGCAPILVNFTDLSSGSPAEWRWDLGNGTVSNLRNASVTYFNPGQYTIKLVVKAGNNRDSVIKTNYIRVYGSPIANFSANATSGCSPFTVNFSDASNANGNTINARQWDFGDGTLSTLQNPSHTYTLAGTFNVTLKITNGNGCVATLRKVAYIRNSRVTAAFTTGLPGTCSPNKIIFQNASTSSTTITSQWNFGDGTSSALYNTTHTYATGGNYIARLIVRNQNGCTDSLTRNLQVISAVSAGFTGDNLDNCRPPVTVHFTNQYLNNNSYSWDFGDSSISSLSNPVHQYTHSGNYTVKLLVRNTNGCTDSFKRTNYVKIHQPLFSFSNLPDSGCQAFTKQLTVSKDSAHPVTNYLWDFGDGATSSDSSPTHTFAALRYYTVSLIVAGANGCRDTSVLHNAIRVTNKPAANFSANTFNTCAKNGVVFTNLSTGGATAWQWDFGDYIISNDESPIHSYKDTGWMSVGLIAANGGCADTVLFPHYLYIKPALAKFTITMDCGRPFERRFLNLSKGYNRCLWDFGDGDTSTVNEPVHIYRSQGEFSVTLRVWNDSTGCDHSLTKKLLVLIITPSFFASDTIACKGTSINFSSSLSYPDVVRFYWNFGDGTALISRGNTIDHVYNMPGIYSVRLVSMSALNCFDTIVKPMYIKINGPNARFGLFAPGSCANSSVLFLDSSAAPVNNPVVHWIWRYGDGMVDTLTAPPFQHSYAAGGTYTVSMKLIDSKGCTDTFRLPGLLKINKVNASFNTTDTVACPNQPVKFTCPYTSPGAVYRWQFGDGTASGVQNPIHDYTAEGIYTVKLYIRDTIGCEDSSMLTNIVSVVQTTAIFSISDSFRICPPLLVHFTNQSINSRGELWDFGDSTSANTGNPSHFYTRPGIYFATLYAKGPGGCVATMQRRIEVKGPTGNFSYSPLKFCTPFNVDLRVHSTNAVSYTWDFNDGATITNTDTFITHAYVDSGNFVPKIILIDDAGCRVPVTGKDTITSIFVKPGYTFPEGVACTQTDISFINTSVTNDSIASYHWDFGDSTTTALKNPDHQYTYQGLYYPVLTVNTRFGCTGQFTSSLPAKVALSPNIHITTSGNGCAPYTATWAAAVPGTDPASISWYWDFDGNNFSDLQNPLPQLYTQAGTYNAMLTAITNTGCTKILNGSLIAFAAPALQSSADTLLCRGKAIALSASGAARYKWMPSTALNCDTCGTVIASPLLPTQYVVTGTSPQGCSSSNTIAINVKQPIKITTTFPSGKLCAGQSKQLKATGATTYQWSPAYGLNNAAIASPSAQPGSTTNYRVIGTDDVGCFKDTGFVKLTVYPIPTINAGEDKTINVGRAVDLEARYSADVTEVQWYPTDGLFRNTTNTITVKPKQNTEYTVEVKNGGGCSANDRVQVFVLCNGTNVFMPNLFSPNNDGVNDVFYPRGTGLFKIKNLRIYNRWGEAVFEKGNFNSNDPSAGWDGTFKGTKLGTDVYVYMMELICDNNNVLAFNGNISLIR